MKNLSIIFIIVMCCCPNTPQAETLYYHFPQEQEVQTTRGIFSWLFSWGTSEEDNDEDDDNEIPKIDSAPFNLKNVLQLEAELNKAVIGQPEPVKITTDALIRYAAGLNDLQGPISAFLYVGPSGVGKTELAKALAHELFGNTNKMIRFNMAEFSQEHTVTRLIGTGWGYVGGERGGQLTNAIIENPYSVILLDEIDKAHPKVQKLFLQAFDEGQITSANGEVADCRNSVFILTSNYASHQIIELQESGLDNRSILSLIEPYLMQVMAPELYNRVTPLIFSSLTTETLHQIAIKMLTFLKERVRIIKGINLEFDALLIDYLVERGYHPTLGARPLKRLIDDQLTTVVAKAIVEGSVNSGDTLKFSYASDTIAVEHIPSLPLSH